MGQALWHLLQTLRRYAFCQVFIPCYAVAVPTNGMRACTAAIIELSAHDLPNYTSEVEFVSR